MDPPLLGQLGLSEAKAVIASFQWTNPRCSHVLSYRERIVGNRVPSLIKLTVEQCGRNSYLLILGSHFTSGIKIDKVEHLAKGLKTNKMNKKPRLA